jgi:hypothetical protein
MPIIFYDVKEARSWLDFKLDDLPSVKNESWTPAPVIRRKNGSGDP